VGKQEWDVDLFTHDVYRTNPGLHSGNCYRTRGVRLVLTGIGSRDRPGPTAMIPCERNVQYVDEWHGWAERQAIVQLIVTVAMNLATLVARKHGKMRMVNV